MTKKERDKQWGPWIDVVNAVGIDGALHSMKTDQGKRVVAAALSVTKWHPDNPSRGRVFCGLCAYWLRERDLRCKDCPMTNRGRLNCGARGSLWWNADEELFAHGKAGPATDKLYRTLMAIYREEYRKYMKGD